MRTRRSIHDQLRRTATLLVAGLLLASILAIAAVWIVRVGGPISRQLEQGKDVIADVLPPPKFIVESHLLVLRLSSPQTEAERDRIVARLAELERDFETATDRWRQATLPADVAEPLNVESTTLAHAYFDLLHDAFLPAVLAGDHAEAARLAHGAMNEHFERHRAAIERVVLAASAENARVIAGAARSSLLLSALVVTLCASAVLATVFALWRLSRSIVGPVLETAGAMRALAAGAARSSVALDKSRDDELGDMIRAFDRLLDSIGAHERALRLQADQLATQNAELERSCERAERASRAKTEFLATVGHEIRTPLTAILGYADLLREEGDILRAPERRRQTIETIGRAGRQLLEIVGDVLDLSKIEAGQLDLEECRCELPSLLAECVDGLRIRTGERPVSVAIAFATEIPQHIMIDPTRFRQILLNVAGNAVKFTDRGAVRIEVAVTGEAPSRRLRIDVADTGPGIAPAAIARLFEPFAQADSSMTRRHGGTGLGLALCRRLSSMMGGSVELLRSEVGVGSTFRIELPLAVEPSSSWVREPSGTHGDHAATSGDARQLVGRVLLAEDGVDNQRLIAHHLRRAGADVDIAENGRVALEMLAAADGERRPYALLVSDMQMPEVDGYALARAIRAQGSTIPIVALTAHAMADDAIRCIEAGCNRYATKPIDRMKLIETCVAVLRTAA